MCDPWDWNVDRVVQELCTTHRTWQPQSPAMPIISDPHSLETILREQEVTGSVLLGEINMDVLKDDFGIKALGRRSFIMSAIDQFRSRSVKYNSYATDRSIGIISSELERSLQKVLGQFQQTNQIRSSSLLDQLPQNTLRSSGDCELYLRADTHPYQSDNTTKFLFEKPKDGDFIQSDSEVINKRRKLTPVSLPQGLSSTHVEEPRQDSVVNDLPSTSPLPAAHLALPAESPIEEISDINGKKRKRIAPTRVSSVSPLFPNEDSTPVFSSDVPKISDEVTTKDPELSNPEVTQKPGVIFRDLHGRKRVIPIQAKTDLYNDEVRKTIFLGNGSASNDSMSRKLHQDQITNSAKSTLSKSIYKGVFLGKKKMNVDALFYEGIPVGSKISNEDDLSDFYHGPKSIPKGRRLYVHNCLKYFLRSQRQDVYTGGKLCSLKVPYSRKLVTKFKDQSFTLYHSTTDGKITARREVNIEAPTQYIKGKSNEHLVTFNPMNRNILEQIGSGSDWDCSTLEKYKYLEGGDEILPIYGESDEDNEFDEATWKEIESEYGEWERPQYKLKKSPISEQEVLKAIDSSITDIINSWKTKDVPKRERKGWRLWRQSRRLQNKREQIIAAKIDLNHIQEYMAKMRDEILADTWTSTLQVRRQVKSMETSVISREELKWKISVLKQKRQPEKPPIQSTPKPKKDIKNTEKDIEGDPISQSDSDYSSHDDLGSFIDDDEVMPNEAQLHELDFADSENENAVVSDASSLDDPIPLPDMGTYKNNRHCKSAQESSANSLDNREDNLLLKTETPNHLDDGENLSSSMDKSKSTLTYQKPNASVTSGPLQSQFVDLTLTLSDDSEPNQVVKTSPPQKPSNIPFIDITMSSEDENCPKPKLKSAASTDSQGRFLPTTDKLKEDSKAHPLQKLDSSDAKSTFRSEKIPSSNEIPPLSNPKAIANYSYDFWQMLGDKQRILAKLFYEMIPSTCSEIIDIITSSTADRLLAEMKRKLGIMSFAKSDYLQSKVYERMRILFRIMCIYEIFTDCNYYSFKSNLDDRRLRRFRQVKHEDFHLFCQTCVGIVRFIKQNAQLARTPKSNILNKISSDDESNKDGDFHSTRKVTRLGPSNASEGEMSVHERSSTKRRKPVHENKEARHMREQNLHRLAQQNERRKKLHAALVKANDDQAIVRSQLIINDAAAEDQKFIYVNDHIAKRIKKHQVEGVRFLWNQIVTIADEQSMQGCLLAHTMGLGKTMQT